MQGRTIVVRMANSTAQFNWLKWVGIVKSFKAGNNVGVFMHDPQVVWEAARAQRGTRIKEDSQLHVVSGTKAEMDMGKPFSIWIGIGRSGGLVVTYCLKEQTKRDNWQTHLAGWGNGLASVGLVALGTSLLGWLWCYHVSQAGAV